MFTRNEEKPLTGENESEKTEKKINIDKLYLYVYNQEKPYWYNILLEISFTKYNNFISYCLE